MGSKILTSIFSFLIAAALLALIGFLDFVFIFSKYGELEFLLKEIFGALSEVFSIDLSWGAIITEIIQAVFGWIGVLTSGFLAVTLCMTLISAVRGKGILCCVAYVLINLAFDFFSNNITDMANLQGELAQMILLAVLTVIYAGACFFFSCHILKRELSL
jgi:cellobiose-specific phosphotransferase system component IIC